MMDEAQSQREELGEEERLGRELSERQPGTRREEDRVIIRVVLSFVLLLLLALVCSLPSLPVFWPQGMQKQSASAAQPGRALGGSASVHELDPVGRVAFYNVGLFKPQLVGGRSRFWFRQLKDEVIKAFAELRCDMLCLSEMGEVQEGLESAFAAAESSSGVAQPAPGALRRWFQGALQEVHEGDWGIYPRGHYVTLVCPDATIEVQSEWEELCVLSQNGNTPMGAGGDLNFSLFALRAGLQEAGLRLHGDRQGLQSKPSAADERRSGAWRASAAQRGQDPPSKAPGSARASAAQPGQDLHQFYRTRFQATSSTSVACRHTRAGPLRTFSSSRVGGLAPWLLREAARRARSRCAERGKSSGQKIWMRASVSLWRRRPAVN